MNRFIIPILVIVVLLLSACTGSVELINHTPEKFPVFPENWEFEIPIEVRNVLYQLARVDEHRFFVEAKSQNVDRSSINVEIWLDGTWHNMQADDTGRIWYYDSPDKCRPSYEYAFREFHSGGGAVSESPGDLYITNVAAFESVSWYQKQFEPVRVGIGPGRISEVPDGEEIELFQGDRATIVVQNLQPDPVRVFEVVFNQFEPDDEHFELLDIPPELIDPPDTDGVVLNCGESFEFEVRFNPAGPPAVSPFYRSGITVSVAGDQDYALIAFIRLVGRINPS